MLFFQNKFSPKKSVFLFYHLLMSINSIFTYSTSIHTKYEFILFILFIFLLKVEFLYII